MSKLNILCGEKIMGWKLTDPGSPWPPGWNPEKCLDDALVCLERAFKEYPAWSVGRGVGGKPYFCYPHAGERSVAETMPIAMCLCSLRAMGVPESEISLAMEE